MRPIRQAPCCCCGHWVQLMPFLTIADIVDLTEGMCRDCLRTAAPDRRALLREARLELRLCPGLGQIVLFFRAWESVKASAIERQIPRAA